MRWNLFRFVLFFELVWNVSAIPRGTERNWQPCSRRRTNCPWVLRRDPILLDPASGSISLGSWIRSQLSWVLLQDPFYLGYASRLGSLGSCIGTQSSWILCQDPRFLGLGFIDIIICIINIIIFLILQSIHLKNKILSVIKIIIFIIIQSIYIKNIIIYVINILIFITIQSINLKILLFVL